MHGGINPFLLTPGWLDAAYMSYAWPEYFRAGRPGMQPPHIPPPNVTSTTNAVPSPSSLKGNNILI